MFNLVVNSKVHEIYRVDPWRKIDDLFNCTVSNSRHFVSCGDGQDALPSKEGDHAIIVHAKCEVSPRHVKETYWISYPSKRKSNRETNSYRVTPSNGMGPWFRLLFGNEVVCKSKRKR